MEEKSLVLNLGTTSQTEIDSFAQIEDLLQEVERLNVRIQALEEALALKELTLENQARQIQSLLTPEREETEKKTHAPRPQPLAIGKRGAAWM